MEGAFLLHAQAWWDAQRFDQPVWHVVAWRDQKVRHIHLHVAKALGKVVAALGEEARPTSSTDLMARVRDEVLPDVAIYRVSSSICFLTWVHRRRRWPTAASVGVGRRPSHCSGVVLGLQSGQCPAGSLPGTLARKVFHMCWASQRASKLIAIDKQPNHQIVHLFRLRKTNRAAH